MFGYQGWFSAPGDGSLVGRWFHWTKDREAPNKSNMAIDLWPDLSEFGQDELISTALHYSDGSAVKVFSSFNPKTTRRHFEWMAEYGIDGIFLQRFLSEVKDPALFQFRNEVTKNVLVSAKSTGRVVAMMYDLSGANPETFVQDLINDWKFLVDDLHLLETDRYLRNRGRPLLALWGMGFKDRRISPSQVLEVIRWFTLEAPEKYRVTLMGGVPTFWRAGAEDSQQDPTWRLDADPDPRWKEVYRKLSVISPWMVGRIKTLGGIEKFKNRVVRPDILATTSLGIDYMPVVFPGFSWSNLKGGKKNQLNAIPRLEGKFYWSQIYSYLSAGSSMLYGAMFDELDEGTAIMKAAKNIELSPTDPHFLTLDADDFPVPSDWYLRIAGHATAVLGGSEKLGADLPVHLNGMSQ